MLRRRGQPGTSVPRWRRARRWALVAVAAVAVIVAVALLRRPGDGHPLPEREQALEAPVGTPLPPLQPGPLDAYEPIMADPPLDVASIERYPLAYVLDTPVELEIIDRAAIPTTEPDGDGVLDGDPWRLRAIWQVVLAAGVLGWVERRLTRRRRSDPDRQTDSSSVAAPAMSSTCGSTADSSVGS